MFIDTLYTIKEKRETATGFDVDVSFDETHFVYKAHFPENPITPGVCLLEVAKQIIATHYNSKIELITVKNIKFLHVIVPNKNEIVSYKVATSQEDGQIKANIVIDNAEVCFAKISVIYKKG